jgi:hypothetical protein
MWEITWFEKIGDNLLGEIIIGSIHEIELKKVFSFPLDEQMIYVYPIQRSHVDFLQKYIDEEAVDHKIDLEKYDYFLERVSEQA